MKKLILFFVQILITINAINSQEHKLFRDSSKSYDFTENLYTIAKNAQLYDTQQNVIEIIPKYGSFKSSKFAYIFTPGEYYFGSENDYLIGYKDGWISVDNLALNNSELLPEKIITNNSGRLNKRWLAVWYNSIANSSSTLDDYSAYHKLWKNSEEYTVESCHHIEFRNTVVVIYFTVDQTHFLVNNIQRKNNLFYINCEIAKSDQRNFNKIMEKESFSNLPDLRIERHTTFIIEPNGNRLRVYNGENKKLIIELMQTDQKWMEMLKDYINGGYKNKPANLKVIEEKLEHPWSNPVTGLYDTSVRSGEAAAFSNVAPNKTMTVKENLKLRSGEATTTSVLAVMSAGTRVKILTLGKQATIDGITGNWVQVGVQAGAKDRDGKAIAAGTTGWCFGGYLTER